MKKRFGYPVLFVACYLLLAGLFVVYSGAGHDWGTGAMVIMTLPLGLVALVLDYGFPNQGFVLFLPILGLLQYLVLGYWLGRRADKKGRLG